MPLLCSFRKGSRLPWHHLHHFQEDHILHADAGPLVPWNPLQDCPGILPQFDHLFIHWPYYYPRYQAVLVTLFDIRFAGHFYCHLKSHYGSFYQDRLYHLIYLDFVLKFPLIKI